MPSATGQCWGARLPWRRPLSIVVALVVMAMVVIVIAAIMIRAAVLMPVTIMIVLAVIPVVSVLSFFVAASFALMLLVSIVLVTPPLLARVLTFVRMVTRRVYLVIPTIRHEIDGPAAGTVFMAMLRPMPFVARRNVQVQRRGRRGTRNDRHGNRDHGPGEDQFGRRRHRDLSANRELAVEARRRHVQ